MTKCNCRSQRAARAGRAQAARRPAQAALLRFLDDQQVRPVGGHSLRKVDVQLLAATHANLEAEVAAAED